MDRPDALVTVVVPVRDDPRIRNCVEALLAGSSECGRLEILVVDHRSAADIPEHLEGLGPNVEVVRYDGATVYGARNLGVARAAGDVIFFTDADCEVAPGWFRAALEHLERGADIVQGFSTSLGEGDVHWLLQTRAEARFKGLRPGAGVECDTKNLAVRRAVFRDVLFRSEFRRTGDTEFGLVAQRRGYRVGYCPGMRVAHAHEEDLPLFIAKQVCHGWGAQRIMAEFPDVRWNGGHLRAVARASNWFVRVPAAGFIARSLASASIRAAGALQAAAPRVPAPLALGALTCLDKAAALAGHILFTCEPVEPSPSALLGRDLVRN